MLKNLRLILFCLLLLSVKIALATPTGSKPTTPSPLLKERYQQYIAKGINFLDQNNYSEAEHWFRKAQGFLPNLPDAYTNLAIIKIYRGDIKEAKELLSRAEKMASSDYAGREILFYNLGVCFHIEEDYPNAVKYFSEALELNPAFNNARYGLEMSSEHLQDDQHKDAAAVDSEEHSSETEDTGQMAQQLLQEGSRTFSSNADEAILLIQKSISLKPENAEAFYRLGVIYDRQGQLSKAVECFKNAIETSPDLAKAHLNLGSAYGKLKKYKLALAAFNKAAKFDPDNPKIPYNISMVYIATGKRKKAFTYLDKAKVLCLKNNDAAFLQRIHDVREKIRGK